MDQRHYDNETALPFLWRCSRSALAFIDWKSGLIGGVFMGALVWLINMTASHPPDILGSSIAAMKQCVYTLLVGGFIVRLSEWIGLGGGIFWIRLTVATIFPTLIASLLIYGVHLMRGTPSPLLSTIPVIVVSLIGLPIIISSKRKNHLAKADVSQ